MDFTEYLTRKLTSLVAGMSAFVIYQGFFFIFNR